MELEEYFDFQAPTDIRIKGTRIGIESVLDYYLTDHWTAKRIAKRYETLTLEQIYATLLFYERNKAEVQAYMENHWEYVRRSREEFYRNPPPDVIKLREYAAKMKEQKAQAKKRRTTAA